MIALRTQRTVGEESGCGAEKSVVRTWTDLDSSHLNLFRESLRKTAESDEWRTKKK